MNNSEFLDLLEQRQYVSSEIVAKLRAKAESGDNRITPKAVLKYLVKKDLIDRSVAKQLLKTTLTVSPHAESSIMGEVPLSIKPPRAPESKQSKARPKRGAEEEIPTLAPLEEEAEVSVGRPEKTVDNSTIFEDSSEPSPTFSGLASLSAAAKEDSHFRGEELAGAEAATTGSKRKKKANKNEWDSSLLLLGGGGLMILILAGVTISYLLTRENADALLQEASSYFEAGSYTQAIGQYERFVENFPTHPQASTAKVNLGMARLWRDTSQTSNPEVALETAKQVLSEIEDEEDFRSAQRDLASLLPRIAQGLADKAEAADDPDVAEQRVEQAREALSLCVNTRYIPSTFRDDVVLQQIDQTLDRVRRNREQSEALAATVAAMQESIEAGDIATAYGLRGDLLERFPALVRNEQLAAKVEEISTAEAAVVEFVQESVAAETTPRPSPVVATLALAERRSKGSAEVDDTVAIGIAGSVYGLRASDGTLDWRQFVGGANSSAPRKLPNGDWLVIDDTENQLMRLKGSSGELVWRVALGAPLLSPVVFQEHAYVADRSGRMHLVELATGERSGFVQFGQPLAVSPTVDAQKQRLYAIGEHSSLYTIDLSNHTCLGVHYLGHAPESISIPGVKVLDRLLAAINTGAASSKLVVLSTDSAGLPQSEETSQRLQGLVKTPLAVDGRRAAVVTTSGRVFVVDVTTNPGSESLTTVASRDSERGPPVARFGLLRDGHVWLAGNQINKLAIMPTGNQLSLRTLENDFGGDTFDHPLISLSEMVIHIRRPAGQAGVIVAATNAGNGQTVWETELAVPQAGAPSVDSVGMRISSINATGAAFLVDRQDMSRRVRDEAIRVGGGRRNASPLTESVDLGQGRLAVGSPGRDTLLHFRPDVPRGPLTSISLASPLASSPVAWKNGFVVPTEVGQVYYFSSDSGEQLATPFQPALEAGAKHSWLSPAVYGEGDDAQLVLSDGVERMYLVAIEDDPQPHLHAAAEVELGSVRLNSRLAVCGDFAVAGTESGSLAWYALPSLEQEKLTELGGEITWGPFAVGDQVLLATDAGELVCCDARAEIAWRQPLAHGQPLGTPLAENGELLILWQEQGLTKIDLDNGSELAHEPLGQTAVAGPVSFGNRLILTAADGTLLVVNRP